MAQFDGGIYQIENLVNKKTYIGSTVFFDRRMRDHKRLLSAGKHPNIHLQKSWEKHGDEQFKFNIVNRCSENELLIKEQYYIDKLNPEYNLCRFAGSSRGRKTSDDTKQKLSKARHGRKPALGVKQSANQILLRVNSLRGVPVSDKTKQYIKKANSGKTKTTEMCDNLKKNSTNKRAVLMLDKISGNIIKEFESITHAQIETGATGIGRCCSGERKSAYGYKWKYKNTGIKVAVYKSNKKIALYNSISVISKMYKKSRTYIKKCITNNLTDYEGYTYQIINI